MDIFIQIRSGAVMKNCTSLRTFFGAIHSFAEEYGEGFQVRHCWSQQVYSVRLDQGKHSLGWREVS